MTYSLEELKRKLGDKGWRANTDGAASNGTLGEMVEDAHGRRKNGKPVGAIEEIETEIELEMFQLEQLWQHLGLPTI